MKRHFAVSVLIVLMLGLCAPPLFSQSSGTVKGSAKDVQGNPIVDGVIVYTNQDNGQKYTLKTNKRGEYFSLGLTPGNYNVTLYKNADDAKANKELFHVNHFQVAADENTLDFDLKKEQERAAQGQGLTPEQLKQQQEALAKVAKENMTIKQLNDKIVAASTASKAGDFDQAISILTEATNIDASHDVLWAQLADAYRNSALKQTDPAERTRRLQEAITDYQKAIDLKQKAMDASTKKDPEDPLRLAGYYNNLGEAEGKALKLDDSIKAYNQAAQLNPAGAAGYYYNEGAVLTNAGKVDDAIAAFDKCIAADPTKADAYYQKGVNMIGKATLQGDKMVAPPGTAEAFQKYLELAPTGPYADVAKQMLTSIGAPVETGFGKKKPAKKSQ
ncbi:MAG TPA: carboxypeptidase regulatory-like domain-containing protein [Candidatus Aquilonibacter sp.]|nr:carboxypeptidase regulatory-like domain-containing protein [Candidatus Aquilonibacter sp.]